MKKIGALLLALVLTLGLVGCGGNAGASDLTGKISLDGSTSMEKLVKALAEGFSEKNPGVTVEPQFTGSSTGVESVINKTTDIGNASRELKDSEKEKGAIENIVAIDGIAVIVHTENAVGNLTQDQLKKIYTGEIKNWSEVGGADEGIVVIGREAASGTRGAFEELLDLKDQCNYAQEVDNTGAVVGKVASTSGAIGYVSLDATNDTVKTLQLEGVDATVENIQADLYFLKRPFVMATLGAISEQSDLVKAFFSYIESEEGQQIITQVGLITTK